MMLRRLFAFVLIFFIPPLAACAPLPQSTSPAGSTPTRESNAPSAATMLIFASDADAQVNESSPRNNTGNSTFLQVDGAGDPEVESFIRFTVTGISAPIQSARVRVYDTTNASNDGPAIYSTEAAWNENTITWDSRPARTSEELDNKDNIGTNTWVEYSVNQAVTGEGTFSFVLVADSSDAATFSSRQGSQPPQLVITLADGPTPTEDAVTPTVDATAPTALSPSATSPSNTQTPVTSLTFVTDADARVKESSPSTNYGNGTTLQVDGGTGSNLESYIRFTVTGASGTVQSARLRLYAVSNGTRNGPAIHAADSAWTESEITWNNRPERLSGAVDNKDRIKQNTWVEYDVTPLVTGDGTVSFVLVADSSDAVNFSSRQGNQPPQLVLTSSGGPAPGATPTLSTGDIVLVGAGDISECSNDNDELTAQLLDAIPGNVFTTGDNAYESGTTTEYNNCYGPTWGRHKDRTKPVPGNHEYRTSGASGYFQYFNDIPSYYAYNLGSWRIYALNSEIDVSEDSSQISWLQSDLAANPSQCALAYWHQPRWSSGSHHGSDPDYQALWRILYEAGAELVLNGHEHNYERFAPMNAEGQPDPLGLREFVIGTGGRDLYNIGSPLPTSEVQDDTSYGVLKLTLHESGYEWEFIPAAGSTFTDSGNGECH